MRTAIHVTAPTTAAPATRQASPFSSSPVPVPVATDNASPIAAAMATATNSAAIRGKFLPKLVVAKPAEADTKRTAKSRASRSATGVRSGWISRTTLYAIRRTATAPSPARSGREPTLIVTYSSWNPTQATTSRTRHAVCPGQLDTLCRAFVPLGKPNVGHFALTAPCALNSADPVALPPLVTDDEAPGAVRRRGLCRGDGQRVAVPST